MTAPHTFKKLTRADITGGFSDSSIELILLAMEHGGTGRMSSKGHCIIRNDAGQTTSLSRNTGNGHKRTGNAAQDIKRLFPEITVTEKLEKEVTEKMCAKCKHHKPFSEFNANKRDKSGYQSYCKECQKIASRESYRRVQARKNKDRDEFRTEVTGTTESVPEAPLVEELPTAPELDAVSAWELVKRAVSAELVERVTELEEENTRLKKAIASVHRHVDRVAFNALDEKDLKLL